MLSTGHCKLPGTGCRVIKAEQPAGIHRLELQCMISGPGGWEGGAEGVGRAQGEKRGVFQRESKREPSGSPWEERTELGEPLWCTPHGVCTPPAANSAITPSCQRRKPRLRGDSLREVLPTLTFLFFLFCLHMLLHLCFSSSSSDRPNDPQL
jgi:hypothetical protein